MATSCNNCGCSKAKCGCQDTMLTSPAACPTPVGCPDPEPCSEVFDAQCSIYTGSDIKCIGSTVVAQNTNVANALSDVVNFFCSYIAELNAGSIVESCNDYITVTSSIEPISGATLYTVCFDYAYLLDQLPLNAFVAGDGMDITPDTVGNLTTYTIDNTDKGSDQFIFKNIAVFAQNTIVADSNNDTLTVEAGPGIAVSTDSATDTLRISNISPNLVQNVFTTFQSSFGSTTANTPTDTLRVIGGAGISTSIVGDVLTITAVPVPQFTYEIGQYVVDEGGVIAHRWLSTTAGGTPEAGTVQNYIVVDTADLGGADWGVSGTIVTGALSTWDGQTNTTAIVTAGAAFGTAAVLCDNSTNNGQTDWYLPSLDEFNKIYDNRWEISQGFAVAAGTDLLLDSYWTSTEYAPTAAWTFVLGLGYSDPGNKLSPSYVRAVRKFSI